MFINKIFIKQGGVYSPNENKIYFIPAMQAPESNWHYIDCNNGSVKEYTPIFTGINLSYIGSVYSPTENKMYFIPFQQQTYTHYIKLSTNMNVSIDIMSGNLFNCKYKLGIVKMKIIHL